MDGRSVGKSEGAENFDITDCVLQNVLRVAQKEGEGEEEEKYFTPEAR